MEPLQTPKKVIRPRTENSKNLRLMLNDLTALEMSKQELQASLNARVKSAEEAEADLEMRDKSLTASRYRSITDAYAVDCLEEICFLSDQAV